MTGEFVTDATYGSRSQLMNFRDQCWDKARLTLFGIAVGIPVISAGGDQQCSLYRQRIFNRGDIPIGSMCLSGHRKYPLGSVDETKVQKGLVIMEKAIMKIWKAATATPSLSGSLLRYRNPSVIYHKAWLFDKKPCLFW